MCSTILSSCSLAAEAEDGAWLASNVMWLVAWLFSHTDRAGLPSLVAIGDRRGQHLLGIAGILLGGVLIRLTLRAWRWFILPGTLILATHPALLWFEHAVMAESQQAFVSREQRRDLQLALENYVARHL